jgi:hypothetical protein
MPSWQTIALFIVSALVLNLTPGPAILFILSRCLGQGREAAVISVFGLATASVIHAADWGRCPVRAERAPMTGFYPHCTKLAVWI